MGFLDRDIQPSQDASLLDAYSHSVSNAVDLVGPAVSRIERVGGRTGHGSGFAISPDGLVVTNNHVVDDAKTVRIKTPDGAVIEGKVLGRDPDSDLALIRANDWPGAWAKLKNRILTVTPGWSEAYGLFTKGEAPMVLSYTTSPAYHMVAENTDRYQAAAFSEGHYIQIEVAGLLKNAPDKDLARDFLKFMVTPGFQDTIPTNNWMMPVSATSTPLPDAFGKLVKPSKTFLMSPDDVARNRKAWIDEWLAAMSMN